MTYQTESRGNENEVSDSVVEVSGDEMFRSILSKSKLPVLVKFHAKWCGPCKMMSPHFSALSSELKEEVAFVSVDIEKSREILDKIKVFSLPTLILFDKGSEVARLRGFNSKVKLRNFLRRNLG